MTLYVIETDAPCKRCGERHQYVTSMCDLVVYVDRDTAAITARAIEGSAVRPIENVPEGINVQLDIRKGGKPDPRYPAAATTLPSR